MNIFVIIHPHLYAFNLKHTHCQHQKVDLTNKMFMYRKFLPKLILTHKKNLGTVSHPRSE